MSLTMIHAQLRAHTKQAPKNTSAPPKKKPQQFLDLYVIATGGGGDGKDGCSGRQRGGSSKTIKSDLYRVTPWHWPQPSLVCVCKCPTTAGSRHLNSPSPVGTSYFPGIKGASGNGGNRVFHFCSGREKKSQVVCARALLCQCELSKNTYVRPAGLLIFFCAIFIFLCPAGIGNP